MRLYTRFLCLTALCGAAAAWGQEQPNPLPYSNRAVDLQLDQSLIRSSPVLRRWLQRPPDLLQEIDNTPAVPTRLQLTVSTVPSRGGDTEWGASLQDLYVAGSRVSLSTEYAQSFVSQNRQWGAHARVYLFPLGSQLNVAPVVGYRHLVIDGLTFQGPEVGTRFVLASPQAADISLLQSFVLNYAGPPVGRTVLSLGYALSPLIRISALIQWQNSLVRQDTTYGIGLELVN